MSRLWRDTRGAVLMEYVLVTCAILLPLMGISFVLSNPTGSPMFGVLPAEGGQNYGILGQAFVDACREIMCGVSIPLP